MDRKQPLLLVLMITLFGIAIAAAIWVFGQRNVQVRRDAMIADVQRIAADAHQYRMRPATMGGGGGSYLRYSIPQKLRRTPLADYDISQSSSTDTLIITVEAVKNLGTITASVEPGGGVRILSLTGDLAH